jgi:hypothetical protein
MFSIDKKSIKYLETPNGVAYSADLYEDDKHIGTIHNNGNGGATFLNLYDGFGTPVHKRLEEAALSFDAMEWYLEHLMNIAEKVIPFPIQPKQR